MDCFDSKQSDKIVFNQSESLSFNYRGMMDFVDFMWKLDEFIKLFKYLEKVSDDDDGFGESTPIKVGDDKFYADLLNEPISFYLDDDTVIGTVRGSYKDESAYATIKQEGITNIYSDYDDSPLYPEEEEEYEEDDWEYGSGSKQG
jgi:hypothetical protein